MVDSTRYQVAVIIPTLNEERFSAGCLDSVVRQTYPFGRMDVMVIDGGSKDRTRAIVEEFGRQYDNIRLLDNPGRIQSVAFNIGCRGSDAPYVIRLDAHVSYDIRYVELCISYLMRCPELGNVGGICKIIPPVSHIIAESNAILNQVPFGIGGAAFRVGKKAAYVDTVPFGAFPRTVIEQIGGMREDLIRGEDNEYNSRIRKAGYKILFDPQIECTYYARDTVTGSVRQMYANGKSIGRLVYIDRTSIGLRHLVPLCFVLCLLLSFVFGFIWLPIWWFAGGILLVYFIAATIATLSICRKFGFKYVLVLPWLFFVVHFSYGCGTIVGLAKH